MESALGPMRFRFVPPLASQERRKRRWLGGKKVGEVKKESRPTAVQERGEGRRGAFPCPRVPIAANVTSGA